VGLFFGRIQGLRHHTSPKRKRPESRFCGDFGMVFRRSQSHGFADFAAVRNVVAEFRDEAKSQKLIKFGVLRVVS
jgi:hypothetical protein